MTKAISKSVAAGALKIGKKTAMSNKTKIALTSSKSAKPAATVRFGAVTISAQKPSKNMVKRNIAAGQSVLAELAKRIVAPGVTLQTAKDVPLYYVDENHPGHIIRELNGKKARGVLKNGQFRVKRK